MGTEHSILLKHHQKISRADSFQDSVPNKAYTVGTFLIPLTQDKFAIVDEKDFEWLNQWRWRAQKSRNTFYARRWEKGKSISMHRQILNVQKGQETDHKNRNGLDNRRFNIRIATHSQNQQNTIKHRGLSIYKGVWWRKTGENWVAAIRLNRKAIYLGDFDSEIEAAKAYDQKAKELFGEFAMTNF